MPYIYPPAAPVVAGDNITISRFLNDPGLIARRLQTMLQQRFISDALLTGRYTAQGGAIQYEGGESLYTNDDPRAVAPGSEYPLTTLGNGVASIAKTVKWGQDTEVTDESIARQKMQPVQKALTKLANQNVKYIDGVSLAAVASAVTQSTPVQASWTTATAEQMLLDVALAKASVAALNQGFELDTIVLSDIAWARAFAKFAAAGYLGREGGAANPIVTGTFPELAGLRWLVTPNLPTPGTILLADTSALGGMADEEIGGPGYARVAGVGVEVKTIRKDDEDKWRLRARRVTVPIVNEPSAAWKLTGAGV